MTDTKMFIDPEQYQTRALAIRDLLAGGKRVVKVTHSSTRVAVEDPADGNWTIYDAVRNVIVYCDIDGFGGREMPLPTDASAPLIAAILHAVSGLDGWLPDQP